MKFVLISEPAQKCENNCAILSKTILFYGLLLLKWPILAVSAWGGNLDFPEFLQKKFYNINYRSVNTYHRGKCHCMADLLFDWFGFNQTSKADDNST